jgi:CRP/FNR family transcriptional regulator, cyclic AMP receptor protein
MSRSHYTWHLVSKVASKVFLIVSSSSSKVADIEMILKARQNDYTVYSASDAPSAFVKMKNVLPNVVVADIEHIKVKGSTFVDTLLHTTAFKTVAIVMLQPPPEQEAYLDEIAIGRVQFLGTADSLDEQLQRCLQTALAYSMTDEESAIRMRFAKADEVIIKKGDKADFVFILKRGRLLAYHSEGGDEMPLGTIDEGEFVGEMAIINGEPRSANVKALVDSELIEIPVGTFESVLYQRPAWAKGMMRTLSKRLKSANQG